jgi:tyrosinase
MKTATQFPTSQSFPFPRCTRLILAMSLAGLSCVAQADSTRISAFSFAQDPAKVSALQTAVATMRANNSAVNTSPPYLASWQYWANIHGYLGTGPHAAGTTAVYVPQQIALRCSGNATCISYYQHLSDTPVPADRFTAQIWGNCQHGNYNFLPWHRMYLHFFERVLRKQSGNPNLNLPYWDYFSETARYGGVALPVLVRGPAAGPLYDQFRTPGINESSGMNPNDASATQAFKYTYFPSFSNQLQNQPHGTMHCATGMGCRAPDIGLVALAGNDPVFYMHHANIDRLWQCWLNSKANGQTINLAWAKSNLGMPDSWYQTSFDFVDEDGNVVTRTIADVFTPGVMDTHYDNENNCAPAATLSKVAALTTDSTGIAPMKLTPASNTKGVMLKGKTVSVPLQASTDAAFSAVATQKAGVKAGNALLVIENIGIRGDPEVTYEIYISDKNKPKRRAYIATLNYFGLFEPERQGHQHHASSQEAIGTLTYDVQAELMQLGLASTADVAVTFVPSNPLLGPSKERGSKGGIVVGNIHLGRSGGTQ